MCLTSLPWLTLVFLLFVKDGFALRDVALSIRPRIVEKSRDATLICSYDLQGASLYYVKWYRGILEFYRFTPSETPSTKLFPFAAIRVDVNRSNSTQVVLTDIDFQLSGNFSCEVTTAEEPASTQTAVESMLVVQLPASPPTISVGREPLDYGDVLRANCTSPPSRPVARLKFSLNNLTVGSTSQRPSQKAEDWSDLMLELKLDEFHFSRGKLILKCVAQVSEIYQEEAVLELASARNPIPEKVRAVDSAGRALCPTLLPGVLFVLITRL